MDIAQCQDCKKSTEIVLDHTTGDTICTECGCVLEAFLINEGCEWRAFKDDNSDGRDPNRVGQTSDPFLTPGNLSTIISYPEYSNKSSLVLAPKLGNLDSLNPDRVLIKDFKTISTMADRLSLDANIVARSKEIFKNVESKKISKSRNTKAMLAACLFIACRESHLPRTFKEICSITEGVSRKELNRAVEFMKKQINVDLGTLNVGELVRRFCSNLGMKNQAMKAVQEAVANSGEIDFRRSPKSVLAAIIFIISQLSDENKPLKDISVVAEVAEGTIKKSYKDLYPHASRLIPNWYAKETDLTKLCCP